MQMRFNHQILLNLLAEFFGLEDPDIPLIHSNVP